jgi:hypothetical protein
MEELRSFIDSEDVVTARWLANALSLKVMNACSIMEKYKSGSSGKATRAFYLLSGNRKDGSSIISVVPENLLERRKKALASLTSCEIYSLQRDSRATALPGLRPHAVLQLYCANSGQEQAMLTGAEPGGEELLSNRSGCVRSSAKAARIAIKPAGERAAYSGYAPPRASSTTPAAASSSSGGKAAASSSASAASKDKEEPVRMSKSSTVSAANFFANAGIAGSVDAGKKSVQPKKEASSSSSGSGSSIFATSPNDAAKVKQQQQHSAVASTAASSSAADDEDAEWDDGTGVVGHKPNKENLKKRKVAMGMPEGSGGLHQADLDIEEDARIAALDEETAAAAEKAETAGSGSKRVSSMHVHGAIDDWKEEGAFGDGPVKKKTKMKAVEKMLMNDRGYMVTTLVEEEVTDDEDEQQAVRAAAAVVAAGKKQQQQQAASAAGASASSGAAKPKPAPAPPKKGAAAAPGPQKGMMSFFGAKK